MNLNSWDFYDLEQEMRDANVSDLLELYKREEKKYSEKCVEYVNSSSRLNDEKKQLIEKECNFLAGCKAKIALRIADTLTK